jgi:hypothetical protein
VTVSVSVADTDVTGVRLDWSGPSGSGSLPMEGSGSAWSKTVSIPIGGVHTFRATAVDASGSTVTGPATAADLDPCAQ